MYDPGNNKLVMLYALAQRLLFTSEHLASSVYNLQADFHEPGKFIITCSQLLMAFPFLLPRRVLPVY